MCWWEELSGERSDLNSDTWKYHRPFMSPAVPAQCVETYCIDHLVIINKQNERKMTAERYIRVSNFRAVALKPTAVEIIKNDPQVTEQ